jgi:hypothetical protein
MTGKWIVLGVLCTSVLSWPARAETVDAWMKKAKADGLVAVKEFDAIPQSCGRGNAVSVLWTSDGHIELRPGETTYFQRGDHIVPVAWRDGTAGRSTPHPTKHPLLGYVKAVRSEDGGTVTWYPLEVRIGKLPPEILVRRTASLVGRKTRYAGISTVSSIDPDRPFPASNYMKLYLDQKALENDDPTRGFAVQSDDFSCGPVAGLNLLRWYGIEEFEPNLSLDRLRREMGTTERGTSPASFVRVLKGYLRKHIGDHYEMRIDQKAIGRVENGLYRVLAYQLAAGHPVVVSYETGPKSSHLAVVVGLVAVKDEVTFKGKAQPCYSNPANDRVILANDAACTWEDFSTRWKKYDGNFRVFLTPKLHEHFDVNKAIRTNSLGSGMLAGVYDREAAERYLRSWREYEDRLRSKGMAIP